MYDCWEWPFVLVSSDMNCPAHTIKTVLSQFFTVRFSSL